MIALYKTIFPYFVLIDGLVLAVLFTTAGILIALDVWRTPVDQRGRVDPWGNALQVLIPVTVMNAFAFMVLWGTLAILKGLE